MTAADAGAGSGAPEPARRRIKPRRLHRGDWVSLVAPSGSTTGPDRVAASIAALENLGFRVKASPHLADSYGYLARADATRARELELAFLDPETKAVICLKGGYGTPRILDLIDYALIAAHPKVFLGYSDITALHAALLRFAGLVVFHGPMPSSDMVRGFDPDSRDSLESALFGYPPAFSGVSSQPADPAPFRFRNPGNRPFRCVAGGVAEGELAGGNLSLVASLMGTPWEPDVEGKILLLEDIDEAPYKTGC